MFSKGFLHRVIKSEKVDTFTDLTAFKPVPKNNILGQTKLKAFADDKINVAEKFKFVLGMVENTVGIGENAGYQNFLLFPQCFQKGSYTGSLKVKR